MREIALARGHVAIVDDEDYAALAATRWGVADNRRGHLSAFRKSGGRRVLMHRAIMGLGHGDPRVVDHINGNSLDNRRVNLRICTPRENRRNAAMPRIPGKSSRFKGVYWRRARSRWVAMINLRCDPSPGHLGTFRDEESAARAYDAAAKRVFGEFARLNFPDHDRSVDPGSAAVA
jgi:hypothetical protein